MRGPRMHKPNAEDICRLLRIDSIYGYVRETNPSNDLPYHNWIHTQHMVESVYEGALYHDLPLQSQIDLVVAALFHDYGHSGGKTDDVTNIKVAKQALDLYTAMRYHMVEYIPDVVRLLISVTQYPFTTAPIFAQEKIIRDADLMEMGRDTWHEMVIEGLRKEIQVSRNREITLEEMYRGQLDFHATAVWYTDWGLAFRENNVVPNLNKIKDLLTS